jgi:antirestriction protein ArdC
MVPTDSAERVERLVALHNQLTTAVEDLANSDAWLAMLQIAARLPTYSPSNVLLITVQRPDATRVAGFRTWKSLGRSVCKGEKGIAILAPCLYQKAESTPPARAGTVQVASEHDTELRVLRGFRIVHVFDVTQTDGDPLPDVAPDLLTGAAPDRLWEQLSALVRADGFTVERGDCRGANGYTRFDDRTVRIRDDVDPAQAVKTLAHELGHIRAGHDTRFADAYHRSVDCRGIAEIEAESIAYLITTTAGLDAGGYSVPYVAGWSGGDAALLRSTATFVLVTATEIDDELTKLRTEATRTIAWNTPAWQSDSPQHEPPAVVDVTPL